MRCTACNSTMMYSINSHGLIESLCSRCRGYVLKDLLQQSFEDDSLTGNPAQDILDKDDEDQWGILDRNHDSDDMEYDDGRD